jgi:hypothetical protein
VARATISTHAATARSLMSMSKPISGDSRMPIATGTPGLPFSCFCQFCQRSNSGFFVWWRCQPG